MKKHFRRKKRLRPIFYKLLYILFVIAFDLCVFNLFKDKYILLKNYDKNNILLLLGSHGYINDKSPKVKEVLSTLENPEYKELRPIIYLYNSHQGEQYVKYNVLDMSKYFKKALDKNGIDAIVEETDIIKEVKNRKLDYRGCYKVSRELLNKVMSDDISLYLDMHRDSGTHKVTTVTVDNKDYAKIMFLIGGKHETYKDNYNLAQELDKLLKDELQGISRGLYVRYTSSYNQDLGDNILLIEVGGPENTKEEINNSIEVLAKVLKKYLEI